MNQRLDSLMNRSGDKLCFFSFRTTLGWLIFKKAAISLVVRHLRMAVFSISFSSAAKHIRQIVNLFICLDILAPFFKNLIADAAQQHAVDIPAFAHDYSLFD